MVFLYSFMGVLQTSVVSPWIILAFNFLTLPLSMMLFASRLHDTGRSARYPLLALGAYFGVLAAFAIVILRAPHLSMFLFLFVVSIVPLVVYLLYSLVVAWFFRGQPGTNAWGPPPHPGYFP